MRGPFKTHPGFFMPPHLLSLDSMRQTLEDSVLEHGSPSISIELVNSSEDVERLGERAARWIESRRWKPSQGAVLLVPDETGAIEKVLLGTGGPDWAEDAPGENFSTVLDEWRDKCESSEDLEEMEKFIQEHCPKWAK